MNRCAMVWLIVAAALTLVGCILVVSVMFVLKWDFKKFSTDQYETNTYEIGESFHSVWIKTDITNVQLVPSTDGTCSVRCYEEESAKHAVAVKDGMLSIERVDTRKWYEHIGLHLGTPRITVCIPAGEYETLSIRSSTGAVEIPKDFSFRRMDIAASTGSVTNHASVSEKIKIKASTGSIRLENLSAGSLELSVSTGKVTVSGVTCQGDISVTVSTGKAHLSDITCQNLLSEGDTGDILLQNVVATETFTIERSTGDVRFEGSDAAQLFVETDTGDVEGSLLSDKVFLVTTDTGEKDVPNSITGGRCEITTDTGDVRITIQP